METSDEHVTVSPCNNDVTPNFSTNSTGEFVNCNNYSSSVDNEIVISLTNNEEQCRTDVMQVEVKFVINKNLV